MSLAVIRVTLPGSLSWKPKPTEKARFNRRLQKFSAQLSDIQQAWPQANTEKSAEPFLERMSELLNTLNRLANEGPNAHAEQLDSLLIEIEACQEEVEAMRAALPHSSVPLTWRVLAWAVLTVAALAASTLLLLSGASVIALSAATVTEILFGLTVAPRLIQAALDLLGFQEQWQAQTNKPLKASLKKLEKWLNETKSLAEKLVERHEQQSTSHEWQAQQDLYQAIVAQLAAYIVDWLVMASIAIRLNQLALINPKRLIGHVSSTKWQHV